MAEISAQRTEYAVNPLGIDVRNPRLSWQLASRCRGTCQTAYQICVASEARFFDSNSVIHDTGKVYSDRCTHVAYQGPALSSRQRYFWKVRAWDQRNQATDWSSLAWWEMAFLRSTDWRAHWIEPGASIPNEALLRREFALTDDIVQARVYVTSLGMYQLFLNGAKVGDVELTPGWTSYQKRIVYQTYDVTPLMRAGKNVLGAMLANGWYCGRIAEGSYGSRTAFLLQFEATRGDGYITRIVTDASWMSSAGPVVAADIYDGEVYDARREPLGWNVVGFDQAQWEPVVVREAPSGELIAQCAPPVRRSEVILPKIVRKSPSGATIVDMGQNMVGWIKVSAVGDRGTRMRVRHGELLNKDGDLYTDNLRSARASVEYVFKGEGIEVYEPRFTFQGFRYLSVEGFPGEITSSNVQGIVVHSDMGKFTEFETSNHLLNQLHRNILWGQRGNFVSIPTDCPQRDERLGWTGDAQVFAETAALNGDVAAFFGSWLADLRADQLSSGSVPWVVPDIIHELDLNVLPDAPLAVRAMGKVPAAGAAGWADAAISVPWAMYLAYGDTRILREQYESMRRWFEFEQVRAGDDLIWSGDFQFGDWLDLGSGDRGGFASTDSDLIATAFFAHSADLLGSIARILELHDDAARYASCFRQIRAAFRRRFTTNDGIVGQGTQAAQVLALVFNLVQESQRESAARHLAESVRREGLTTGFVATPSLLFALSDNGYLSKAYELLLREEYPSWLYPVKQGATTVWERWDGIKSDGSLQSEKMNSFNHYAYGAVAAWIYRVVAGLNVDVERPGYKHVTIRPRPGGGLRFARMRYHSLYGVYGISWRMKAGMFCIELTIPANATATVRLPKAQLSNVVEGDSALACGPGIGLITQSGDEVHVEVESGEYRFRYPMRTSHK